MKQDLSDCYLWESNIALLGNLGEQQNMKDSDTKKISAAVVKRLPIYRRHLKDLMDAGIYRISSKELSLRMKTTSSQIRQDLNQFGTFGQQGYGYNVRYLYDEICGILGLKEKHNTIIIGTSATIRALISKHNLLGRESFPVVGVFDTNRVNIGEKLDGYVINDLKDLKELLKETNVDIAIVELSKNEVKSVINELIENGIKEILNISDTDLRYSPDIHIENINLSDALLRLSFHSSARKREENIGSYDGE